jgi:phospholipase C
VTCRQWVDIGHMECDAWADTVSAACTQWRDNGYSQCDQWADEGHDECSQWADEGHNECQSEYYNECHWYSPWNCIAGWLCDAYYWVANWVCQAYYWVANWICKAWHWVANLVCQAYTWVVRAVCLVWSWVAKLVCVFWDGVHCIFQTLVRRRRRASTPVQHVFVLMLENRAFDHLLGFSAISGKDIGSGVQRPVDGASGTNVWNNVSVPPSTEADFKLDKPDVDPGHEFANTLTALCGPGAVYPAGGGAYPPIDNSGFIANYAASTGTPANPPNIMKCYSPARVPVICQLAGEFALCDQWFSSLPGPTWPNRFFMHAASSGGLDDSPSGLASAGNTLFDGYTFMNGTIFDRLDDACLEWRVFSGDHFPVTLALSGMTLNELQGRLHDFDDFGEAIDDAGYSAVYTFIEPDYGNDLPPSAEDFTCGNSQHPLDDITRGEKLIKDVYEKIRNSPLWEKSLLLVTYDEHGGFYDHVPPPAAVVPGDPVADEDNVHHHFRFDQLGVRVPAVVVSPLIDRGTLDGTVYDHTSLLATLEALFGLKPLTARDAGASSLLKLLTRSSPRSDAPTQLMPAAVSGFTCDDEPTAGAAASSPAAASAGGDGADRLSYRWQNDDRRPGSSLRGFQEIALLKALRSARGRDREQIRKEYFAALETRGGARHFIHKVAALLRDQRISAVTSRRARLSFFGRPPSVPWPADPVDAYRRRPTRG